MRSRFEFRSSGLLWAVTRPSNWVSSCCGIAGTNKDVALPLIEICACCRHVASTYLTSRTPLLLGSLPSAVLKKLRRFSLRRPHPLAVAAAFDEMSSRQAPRCGSMGEVSLKYFGDFRLLGVKRKQLRVVGDVCMGCVFDGVLVCFSAGSLSSHVLVWTPSVGSLFPIMAASSRLPLP